MRRTKASKGFKRTIAFYLLGILLTILVHIFYGFGNLDTPPPTFFVLVFFTSVGVCWFLLDIFLIVVRKKAVKEKADLMVHIVGLLVFGVLIALLWIWGAATSPYQTSAYKDLPIQADLCAANHTSPGADRT